MKSGQKIWQSQNFLKRPEFVSNLVAQANINKRDFVVEIGPGKGIITKALAKRAGRVIAIEKDRGLAQGLRQEVEKFPNVDIVGSDFMAWRLPQGPYKVFSNIPFNTTADIVKKLTEDPNPPTEAYLIMQDKAAGRFMGIPSESQASILLKPWFDIDTVKKIDRREFSPVPNVNTVLAKFEKRQKPLIEDQSRQMFRNFVVYGFNKWEPTIMKAYKDVFSSKQASIIEREIGLKNKKPSELGLSQWVELFNRFKDYVSDEKKRIIKGAESRLVKQQLRHSKWHRTR